MSNQINLVVSAAPDMQFWNGTTTSPTGKVEGGPGTWISDATRNWTDANGTRSDAWADKFSVFQGGRGVENVAVIVDGSAGDIVTTGMQFIGTGWTLTGDPIVLDGANGRTAIRVGDGAVAGAGDTALIGSVLTGDTRLVKDDLGTLILTGANTYSGGTTIAHGTLQLGNGGTAGSITGDIENNGALVFNRSDALNLGGVISGAGVILQTGAGTTTLSGGSAGFSGSTTIEEGALSLNGALGGEITVKGGRLQGIGSVDTVAAEAGGTVAPGNSIGTLTATGNVGFAAGSFYEVEVDAAGHSDLLDVAGDVTIGGGTVRVLAEAGNYAPYTLYTIVSADGGVVGGFAGATSNLAFLAPNLRYDARNVYLLLVRNDVDFSAVGATPNQAAAGGGVEPLSGTNPLYIAAVMLTPDEARAAFDDLSGEIHASARTALMEDSRFVREAALDRARSAFAADGTRFAVWGQGFGSWGRTSSDGNAARLSRSTGGFLVGAEASFDEAFRAGITGGYSTSNFKVPARSSSGDSDNYHIGVYAGAAMGALGLRLGVAYSWHSLETSRSVAFRGFGDTLSADYDAHTAQVFGELAYRFDLDGATVEPFAGVAYVDLRTAAFTEQGGAAALTAARQGNDATFSTLGLRASIRLGEALSLQGTLGWRHTFGGVDQTAALAFVGAAPFTVAGVPLAKDAAVIEAGLEAAASPSITLGVRYSGQIASGTRDHGVKADAIFRF
jgi:outer membrane autotransporter protein